MTLNYPSNKVCERFEKIFGKTLERFPWRCIWGKHGNFIVVKPDEYRLRKGKDTIDQEWVESKPPIYCSEKTMEWMEKRMIKEVEASKND